MKRIYRRERRPARPSLVAFDVDGTLIQHFLRAENGIGSVLYRGGWEERPEVVQALKAFAALEWVEVMVWSAGGQEWAQEVVDILGLGEYVDMVYGKEQYADLQDDNPPLYPDPDIYFDDNGIAAYGKVWVHVDPYDTKGHHYWTPETYAEKDPCAKCGYNFCTNEAHVGQEPILGWELD